MNTIIALAGMPASGKTTIMRAFMEVGADDWEKQKLVDLCPSHYSKSRNTHVMGVYDPGEIFAGSDKMSMATVPKFKEFLKTIDANIVFEGDRLCTQSVLEQCSEMDVDFRLLYIEADERTMDIRHKQRGDNQSDVFIKGRETKYGNLRTNFSLMSYIEEHRHETPADTTKIVDSMWDSIQS